MKKVSIRRFSCGEHFTVAFNTLFKGTCRSLFLTAVLNSDCLLAQNHIQHKSLFVQR